ncbi:hypothetical protein SISNIDRAFT_453828 [Sistotremastrum niveocremeum HHB9708]|uniref:Uncharacterized protein n=1 Tax=Sistotremastrum niveocremeum HHB9708 TaxID=1314777 RepID=A0A164VFD6_9AGAM|nr:hypothetical protein SISNIDRAFT_453828 [Sistotremastrum niveocremeum HHB9708]
MATTGASRDGSEEARVPKSDVLPMLALSTPSIQPIVTALRSQLEIVWKSIC